MGDLAAAWVAISLSAILGAGGWIGLYIKTVRTDADWKGRVETKIDQIFSEITSMNSACNTRHSRLDDELRDQEERIRRSELDIAKHMHKEGA